MNTIQPSLSRRVFTIHESVMYYIYICIYIVLKTINWDRIRTRMRVIPLGHKSYATRSRTMMDIVQISRVSTFSQVILIFHL